ncbi:L-2-hydroxyglutarate oxidase [Halorarius halobius]|uniref:L-2-hydroxyglutarate oxidase n=1 Tax=Halorarius halobius TaxID=2962671 RepID=UPI0020CCEEEB|nr:L-2-hydroxyglutarate oxidase [Halorarius halobius]
MTDHDIAIVGGGIFGVSVAKHLAERADYDICVIEKEYQLATHQSGRNSGVLHPGLALGLEPGTRKAEFAIEGSRRLREYCRERDLPIRDTGLMLVATDDAEEEQLGTVQDRAADLGIELERLDEDGIAEYEPNVDGQAGLYTPDSSTVDTHPITYEMAKDARREGVEFYMGTEVEGVERDRDGITVETTKGAINADYLVNAAGTAAVHIAHELGLAEEFSSVPFRGQYYELTTGRRDLVRTNVYPVSMPPRVPNQVGVHFTRRPDNKVIVGPTGMIALGLDTYGVTDFDLSEVAKTVSSSNFWRFIGSPDTMRIAWRELNKTYRKDVFLKHCRKLVPTLEDADISRSYVGISHYVLDRKGRVGDASRFETGERSFHILRPKPGLTSSLAIGEYVADQVEADL